MGPSEAREIALEVAAGASRILLEGWGHARDVRAKELPTDLVTEWDDRSEEWIVDELSRLTPGVEILAEEGGGRPGASGARWLVDPIDGTINFAHALPLFAVSIAYEEGGVGVAGVVAAPALGWTFAAARGQGATRNGEAIRVSEVGALSRALLATGFPYDRAISPRNNFAAWERLQRRAGAVRRLGAASLDLCFVACGWLDGYWEFKLKPWDLAAGAVIVEEARGRVTALDGGPFSSESGEAIASNGKIHGELVDELRGV